MADVIPVLLLLLPHHINSLSEQTEPTTLTDVEMLVTLVTGRVLAFATVTSLTDVNVMSSA
jgi:hypothetical protein